MQNVTRQRLAKYRPLWGDSTHRVTPLPTPATTMRISLPRTCSASGGKVASLSEEKGLEPIPQWASIGFNLQRNTGICKAHQSSSGSNDQTIDNIPRTMRANFESGSYSQRAMKLWETNSFHAWTLI